MPNLFFFSVFPTVKGAICGEGPSLCSLRPMCGLPAPFAPAGPSEVIGLLIGVLMAPCGLWGSGQGISFALFIGATPFGVLRLCNFGLFGEFCALLVREPKAGRGDWAIGSANGELGPRTRSLILVGLVPVLSALERSRGVSLRAALSDSGL